MYLFLLDLYHTFYIIDTMKKILLIIAFLIFILTSCEKNSEPSIVGKWNVTEIVWIGSVIGFDTPKELLKKEYEYTFDDNGILTERYKESTDPAVGTHLYPYVFNGTSLILMTQNENLIFKVKLFTNSHLTIEKGQYQYQLTKE